MMQNYIRERMNKALQLLQAVYTQMQRASRVAAWFAFTLALVLVAVHYLAIKHSFFDDVFIYLHMAHNAIESGTWQYFPVAGREALLASSPFKLVLLTIATALMSVFGHGARNLGSAQFILLLTGVLGWLAFAPFWRGRMTLYAIAGAIYFLSATAFAAAFDFEGGLLFLWLLTLLRLFALPVARPLALALLLPVGGLIRPDIALIVYALLLAVAATDVSVRQRLLGIRWVALLAVPVLWVALALLFSVYPIPVTYWAKAAIPTLFEHAYFLQMMFERIGFVMNAADTVSPRTATMLGVLLFGTFACFSLPRLRNPAIVGFVAVAIAVVLFGRMPANFWWYYENLIMIVMAVCFANAAFEQREGFVSVRVASALIVVSVLALAAGSKSLRDHPGLWSFSTEDRGRAKGYVFLAHHANGDGTYTLPVVGRVLIKNPEMGITAYFTGRGAWIWDGAGLAQPLDVPQVRDSRLRHVFPRSLWREGGDEAQALVDSIGTPLPVMEVWAMEERNYDEARKKCKVVIVEGALCINPFRELAPRKSSPK